MTRLPLAAFFICLAAFCFADAIRAADQEEEQADGKEEIVLTAADIPDRIARTRVGDWVLYKMADGSRSKLTVVEKYSDAADTYLIITNEITTPKKKRAKISEEKVAISDAVRDLRALGPDDKVTASTVLLMGRSVDAVVVHFVEEGQTVRQSYFSEEIPVYGLIRGINLRSKFRNALTLEDYGFGD